MFETNNQIKSNKSNQNESPHKALLKRLFRAETLNLTVVALHQQPAPLFQEYLIHSLHIHHFIFSLFAHPHTTRASFYYPDALRRTLSHGDTCTTPISGGDGPAVRQGEEAAGEGGCDGVLPPPPCDLPTAGGRQRRPPFTGRSIRHFRCAAVDLNLFPVKSHSPTIRRRRHAREAVGKRTRLSEHAHRRQGHVNRPESMRSIGGRRGRSQARL